MNINEKSFYFCYSWAFELVLFIPTEPVLSTWVRTLRLYFWMCRFGPSLSDVYSTGKAASERRKMSAYRHKYPEKTFYIPDWQTTVSSDILKRTWKEWSACWNYCCKEEALSGLVTVVHQKWFFHLKSLKAPASSCSGFLLLPLT